MAKQKAQTARIKITKLQKSINNLTRTEQKKVKGGGLHKKSQTCMCVEHSLCGPLRDLCDLCGKQLFNAERAEISQRTAEKNPNLSGRLWTFCAKPKGGALADRSIRVLGDGSVRTIKDGTSNT